MLATRISFMVTSPTCARSWAGLSSFAREWARTTGSARSSCSWDRASAEPLPQGPARRDQHRARSATSWRSWTRWSPSTSGRAPSRRQGLAHFGGDLKGSRSRSGAWCSSPAPMTSASAALGLIEQLLGASARSRRRIGRHRGGSQAARPSHHVRRRLRVHEGGRRAGAGDRVALVPAPSSSASVAAPPAGDLRRPHVWSPAELRTAGFT